MAKLDIHIGFIGLGKMGFNMASRLLEKGYRVSGFNKTPSPTKKLEKQGAIGTYSLTELIAATPKPRIFWMMVPYKAVDSVLEELSPQLTSEDVVVDGGNSPYTKSKERSEKLRSRGAHFFDVGVSGGPEGALEGASLMVGGSREKFKELEKVFHDLATEGGYGYMGKSGAGHFVKMVHNGIEYGMMQAIAEGFHIMRSSEYDLPLSEAARVYNHGSVLESKLIGWMESAFKKYGEGLRSVSGRAQSTGEGEWTVKVAHELGVPDNVIHEALTARATSQLVPNYQGKVITALRNQFGGHSIK